MDRHRQLKPQPALNRPFSFCLWCRLKRLRRFSILTIERSCTMSFDFLVQDKQQSSCRLWISLFSRELEPQIILYGFEPSCMGQIPLGWTRPVVNAGRQCRITALSSSCTRISFNLVQDNMPVMPRSQVSPNVTYSQTPMQAYGVGVQQSG
jgi:hypothetical protein